MAGDCPHREQLQSTLQQCQNQTALIAATHDNYLSIIDELKSELDTLSCQVTMVQKEFTENETEDELFETSLRALESQNDLLQQALEATAKQKDEACSNLEQNNESLKCQIDQLKRAMCEKEQRIQQLSGMLTRLSHIQLEARKNAERCPGTHPHKEQELCEARSQLENANRRIESLVNELECGQKQERFLRSETRKLNDELIDCKRKSGDLNIQTRRLASLLKTQEAHRMELSKKYETMEQNYEDQSKKLRAANTQLNCLQDRFTMLDKRDDEHNMERNLLREEVLSLKEKEACMLGKQKSIQEQLLKTERELFTAHDVIKEQQCILQRNDSSYAETTKRLQETINELRHKLNVSAEDCKRLGAEFEKQNELRLQNEKVIESFRKWKEAQLKADDATRCSFKQYEEHIRLLLEEKQKFLEQYRGLHRDYCILQNELDRMKLCVLSTSAPGLNTSDNSISNRMELLRRTSRRLSEQCSSLRADDMTSSQCPPLSSSKSAQNLR